MVPARVLLNPPGTLLGRHNAIITTTAVPYRVDDFPGPLSVKWMARGWAVWRARDHAYRIDPGCYLVLDPGLVYSLTVDTREPRETFCAFFANGFVERIHGTLTADDGALLDDPQDGTSSDTASFRPYVRPADPWVTPQLARMYAGMRAGIATGEWLDDEFRVLAERLLLAAEDVRAQVSSVPAAKAATRHELHRRLCRARDSMHVRLAEPLDLTAIAREACLAPHHFHRLFRRVFGTTPHDYLVTLRIERAKALLRETDDPVTDVCFEVGFESVGSFSALFRREVGESPAAFRRRVTN